MTPAEIETATLRFVAQHLNRSATAVPNARIVPSVNVQGQLGTIQDNITVILKVAYM